MKLNVWLVRGFCLSMLPAIAFGLVAFLVSAHKISRFDNSIISFVQGWESPVLTAVMKGFTFVGSGVAVAGISIVALFFLYKVLNHRAELILFTAVVGGAAILNSILKNWFHRPRPSLHRLMEADGFSFPSGHSMEAMALYGVLAFLLWRHMASPLGRGILIVAGSVMILFIGLSRIYLGVHYPSDVIAGYFASGFWLATAIWIFRCYKR